MLVIHDVYRGISIELFPNKFRRSGWDYRIRGVENERRVNWLSGPFPGMVDAWLDAEEHIDNWLDYGFI